MRTAPRAWEAAEGNGLRCQIGQPSRLWFPFGCSLAQDEQQKLCKARDLAVKTFDCLWNSLQEWWQNDLQGSILGLQFKLCCLINEFYLLQNKICMEFKLWNLVRSVTLKMPKLLHMNCHEVSISMHIPQVESSSLPVTQEDNLPKAYVLSNFIIKRGNQLLSKVQTWRKRKILTIQPLIWS